jgi:hypothetical protein
MSTLCEILRRFRWNVFVIGSAWCTAYVIALVAGIPQVPLFAVAIVLGMALAVLLAPGAPREAVLRHVTHRPRRTMTPGDYRQLREMEIELGWEPSGPACDCGKSAEERAREWDEQIIASQGIPGPALSGAGTLSAKADWDDVAYPSEASEHFAALARVGRERCIGFCPICAERDRPRGGTGRVTVVYHSGTANSASPAGSAPGGGGGGGTSESAWHAPGELPQMGQAGDGDVPEGALEGIPAALLIEKMRQELEAQREATSPEPPAGSHDFHFDSAGREWCRDTSMWCWVRPVPDGPWYRQDKPGGGEQK